MAERVLGQPCEPQLCGVVPWYVLQTEPSREFQAFARVASLPGVKPWLATEVRWRQALRNGRPVYENGARKREQVLRPFFPGYLFAAFDPQLPDWAPLLRRNRETRTVRLFTDSYLRPVPLPAGVIERLQARGRAGDGAIDLEATSFAPLSVGVHVRLPDGPFADLDAVVTWTDQRRVEVLMGLLRATVDRSQVVVA